MNWPGLSFAIPGWRKTHQSTLWYVKLLVSYHPNQNITVYVLSVWQTHNFNFTCVFLREVSDLKAELLIIIGAVRWCHQWPSNREPGFNQALTTGPQIWLQIKPWHFFSYVCLLLIKQNYLTGNWIQLWINNDKWFMTLLLLTRFASNFQTVPASFAKCHLN